MSEGQTDGIQRKPGTLCECGAHVMFWSGWCGKCAQGGRDWHSPQSFERFISVSRQLNHQKEPCGKHGPEAFGCFDCGREIGEEDVRRLLAAEEDEHATLRDAYEAVKIEHHRVKREAKILRDVVEAVTEMLGVLDTALKQEWEARLWAQKQSAYNLQTKIIDSLRAYTGLGDTFPGVSRPRQRLPFDHPEAE